MQNLWRKQMIILEPDIVRELFEWHGGQDSYVYALASWGQGHLISASMIDGALIDLRRDYAHAKRSDRRRDLYQLIGSLEHVRQYWYEHTAHQAGMDVVEYALDPRNYGTSPHDEQMLSYEMSQSGGQSGV